MNWSHPRIGIPQRGDVSLDNISGIQLLAKFLHLQDIRWNLMTSDTLPASATNPACRAVPANQGVTTRPRARQTLEKHVVTPRLAGIARQVGYGEKVSIVNKRHHIHGSASPQILLPRRAHPYPQGGVDQQSRSLYSVSSQYGNLRKRCPSNAPSRMYARPPDQTDF